MHSSAILVEILSSERVSNKSATFFLPANSCLLREERENGAQDPSAALFKSVVKTGRVKTPANSCSKAKQERNPQNRQWSRQAANIHKTQEYSPGSEHRQGKKTRN